MRQPGLMLVVEKGKNRRPFGPVDLAVIGVQVQGDAHPR